MKKRILVKTIVIIMLLSIISLVGFACGKDKKPNNDETKFYNVNFVFKMGDKTLDNNYSLRIKEGDLVKKIDEDFLKEYKIEEYYFDSNFLKKFDFDTKIKKDTKIYVKVYKNYKKIKYKYLTSNNNLKQDSIKVDDKNFSIDLYDNEEEKENTMFEGYYIVENNKNIFITDNKGKSIVVLKDILTDYDNDIELIASYVPKGDYKKLNDGTYQIDNIYLDESTLELPDTYMGQPITKIQNISNLENVETLKIGKNVKDIVVKNIDLDNLSTIEVDKMNSKYLSEDGILFTKDKRELLFYPISKNNIKYEIPSMTTKVGAYSFKGKIKKDKSIIGELEEIIIPENVIEIGSHAFYHRANIKNIEFKERTNKLELKIKGYAFYCVAPESFNFPENLVEIGDYAFSEEELVNENISINSKDTEIFFPQTLKIIGDSAFSYNMNLKKVHIKINLTYLGKKAFYKCRNLSNVDMGYASLSNIKEFTFALTAVDEKIFKKISKDLIIISDAAFSGTNVKELNLKNFSKLKEIKDNAFSECDSLYKVILPVSLEILSENVFSGENFDKSQIEYPKNSKLVVEENGFILSKDRKSLIRVNANKTGDIEVPEGVEDILKAVFKNSIQITSIKLPNSLINIGENAFENIKNITSIDIPKNVKKIGAEAFKNSSFEYINFDDNAELNTIYNNAFENAKVIELVLPNEVENISERAFKGLKQKSFELPDSLVNVGDKIFEDSLIEKLKIPKKLKNGVDIFTDTMKEIIGDDCDNYKIKDKIVFNKNTTEIIFFIRSNNVKTLDLTDDRYKNVDTIAEKAFSNSQDLEFINLSNVTLIGKFAFSNCLNLKQVILSDNLLEINEYAFSNTSLENIDLKNIRRIKEGGFKFNKNLKNLTIPKTLENIEMSSFAGCALEEIIIPGNVKKVGERAFYRNYSQDDEGNVITRLKKVVIEEGVNEIDALAFGYNNFKATDDFDIILASTVIKISKNAFESTLSVVMEINNKETLKTELFTDGNKYMPKVLKAKKALSIGDIENYVKIVDSSTEYDYYKLK